MKATLKAVFAVAIATMIYAPAASAGKLSDKQRHALEQARDAYAESARAYDDYAKKLERAAKGAKVLRGAGKVAEHILRRR